MQLSGTKGKYWNRYWHIRLKMSTSWRLMLSLLNWWASCPETQHFAFIFLMQEQSCSLASLHDLRACSLCKVLLAASTVICSAYSCPAQWKLLLTYCSLLFLTSLSIKHTLPRVRVWSTSVSPLATIANFQSVQFGLRLLFLGPFSVGTANEMRRFLFICLFVLAVCLLVCVARHAKPWENAERRCVLGAAEDTPAVEEDPHHGGRHLQVGRHYTANKSFSHRPTSGVS